MRSRRRIASWGSAAGGGAEDLAGMPGDVVGFDHVEARLGSTGGAAGEGEDHLAGGLRTAYVASRDGDGAVRGQAEDALVEQFVVDRAEAEPVGQVVGAVERPPADMGGVETDRGAVQPTVVRAERAAV